MISFLFRKDEINGDEFVSLVELSYSHLTTNMIKFNVYVNRTLIENGSLVIPRYSSLPFHKELEDDLESIGCKLINSTKTHNYIANMNWYDKISHLTFPTWFNVGWDNVPQCENGWVVKGKTNSKKFQWNRMMRAENKESLKLVMEKLLDDTFIGSQGLVIRKYIPLEVLEEGINGLPFTNEWRLFFYGSKMIAGGFYWSSMEGAEDMGSIPTGARIIAEQAAELLVEDFKDIQETPAFFVLDIARRENGEWIVVEVNDGCMSGLSEVSPILLYKNLVLEISKTTT